MGIITKEVEVKPIGAMIKYYCEKGYDAKYNYPLTVKIEDLQKNSHVNIDVECEICGDIRKIRYKDYNKIIINGDYYCCHNCFYQKAIETNRKRYGCDSAMQNKDVYLKQSKALEQKYGVKTPLKSKDVRDKVENTMLRNFGVKCSFMSEDIQSKIRKSLLDRYGVDNPSKSLEIRTKVAKTLYSNNTTATSKQQLYIFNLCRIVNDVVQLNYPISYYNVDICFPEEKLTIEYDGGFHNGQVKLGHLTQEEFDRKEIIRNNTIKREGYKQMRIISSADKLPSDDILLQMLQDARTYFSLYPSHSWIEFNIDTSNFRNAENPEGSPYNFGDLRTIKDGDLNAMQTI